MEFLTKLRCARLDGGLLSRGVCILLLEARPESAGDFDVSTLVCDGVSTGLVASVHYIFVLVVGFSGNAFIRFF